MHEASATHSPQETIIQVDRVGFSYDDEHPVLSDLSLSLQPGSLTCILGGNGSGKSTLAKHLNALLVPDEGEVRVTGLSTADERALYRIRSTVGLVFQNPDDQIVATVIENDLAFGPENLGLEPDQIRERVTEALASVGMSGFEARETAALSGGQKQRVALAGILAMRPDVLVLDEATAMIDPRGRAGMMKICRRLNRHGLTVVMVTHYMEEAAQADRVVVLDGGRIVMDGPPHEVLLQAEQLERLHLNVPPACALSLALRRRGVPVSPTISEQELEDQLCRLCSIA
ncbi:energy-coupling factor transporter ATPase [Eggerthellaceae bacterium zg-1084]|uniref:Energy-coupling factor transporter ATPase n=1 Tax=Berryella wangjianweii TaxID=2734634 RepID=A0A6M8J0E8_9ACTN|nr:energy-coupling factor transporter ATPase [Berryella wangjianweii]NPD31108.1 energy-coupling factor transporter ATPase [Berryella wangjianweii]QKF07440.1 energy-coupling factor transporter ATPase [Berryella wangjianweii]